MATGPNTVEIVDVEDHDQFFTPISCRGTNIRNPISVEQYSDDRELHLAIMRSVLNTPITVDLSEEPEDDDFVQIVKPFRTKRRSSYRAIERGESSKSKADNNTVTFTCEICAEPKTGQDLFKIMGCTHSYCTECMIKYVATKLQENVTTIHCPVPNCGGLLEPEYCRDILPDEVFDRWGNALCESLILASEKFYCPFKDCSALLLDDGTDFIMQSECPVCNRLFCVQCKVSWHTGIDCVEFQKLGEDERGRDDLVLIEVAKKNNWRRCPMCKFYVEKSEGCMYMKCRCGFAFCYNCGTPSQSHHYHYCANCKR